MISILSYLIPSYLMCIALVLFHLFIISKQCPKGIVPQKYLPPTTSTSSQLKSKKLTSICTTIIELYFISHYWDEGLFKECTFVEIFCTTGLRDFFFKVTQERFPHFVIFFYSNLSNSKGVLRSKVKRHLIQLRLKEFGEVSNLLFNNQAYEEN